MSENNEAVQITNETTKATVPAGAKKPQDRKPKKGEPSKINVRGEVFEVAADALDDFELLDDLAQLEDGAGQKLPSVLRRLIGGEQFKKAMDLARDKDSGRVTNEAGAELVQEILEAVAPNS